MNWSEKNKKQNGGGVALFVDKGFTFNIDEILSVAVDNFFECVNIEISFKKKQKIKKKKILRFMYRTFGSNIQYRILKNSVEESFSEINHKVMYIFLVTNVDFINPNKHILLFVCKITDHFPVFTCKVFFPHIQPCPT